MYPPAMRKSFLDCSLICVLVLSIALIAGCGGDGDDGEGAGSGGNDAASTGSGGESGGSGGDVPVSNLSKIQFTKQASKICAQERKRAVARASRNSAGDSNSPDAFQQVLEQTLVPTLEADVNRLRELGAPSGEEAQVESLLASMETAIAAINGEASEDIGKALQRQSKQAASLGVPLCGVS